MKKLRIYLDTSVISHLFADDVPDKAADTNKFWRDLIAGKYEVYISSTTVDEMRRCAEPKLSKMIDKLNEIQFQPLRETNETKELAAEYIKSGVLTQKSFDDCMHIAFAVANNCDVIVSWNFKHLVNFRTISKVKVVNSINHYKEISIVSPSMLLEEEG